MPSGATDGISWVPVQHSLCDLLHSMHFAPGRTRSINASWCRRSLCSPLRTRPLSHTLPSLILLKVFRFSSPHGSRLFSALYSEVCHLPGWYLERSLIFRSPSLLTKKNTFMKASWGGLQQSYPLKSYRFLVFKSWTHQACTGLCV